VKPLTSFETSAKTIQLFEVFEGMPVNVTPIKTRRFSSFSEIYPRKHNGTGQEPPKNPKKSCGKIGCPRSFEEEGRAGFTFSRQRAMMNPSRAKRCPNGLGREFRL
jgi:hypothetical protein